MPVSKSSAKSPDHTSMTYFHTGEHGRKILSVLVGIALVYGIVYMGTLIRNNIEQFNFIGKMDKGERTITVEGQAKVTAQPDVGMTTIGMTSDGKTVAEAQQKNTDVMNTLISKLKTLGIDKADIQTSNYNIYPQYNYTQKDGRVLLGYEVQQQVTVKIRDLTKANQVIALAGEVGANSVGGLTFTIDDRDVYKDKARQLALQKVRAKAIALSRSLGVTLGSVVSYYESEGGVVNYPMYAKAMDVESGGMVAPAPSIESGSMDVTMNVQVMFELK